MKKTIIALSLLTAIALASCGSESSSSGETAAQASTSAATEEAATGSTTGSETEAATEHATAPQNEVGFEGMKEIGADALNIGNYYISVDSS